MIVNAVASRIIIVDCKDTILHHLYKKLLPAETHSYLKIGY